MERFRHLTHINKNLEMVLYEVKLNPDIPISAAMHVDNNEDQPRDIWEMGDTEGMTGEGANRYINRYENVGSVSLMVNNSAFEIINSTPVKMDNPA